MTKIAENQPKYEIQLLESTQQQQASQLEPELGTAQPQLVSILNSFQIMLSFRESKLGFSPTKLCVFIQKLYLFEHQYPLYFLQVPMNINMRKGLQSRRPTDRCWRPYQLVSSSVYLALGGVSTPGQEEERAWQVEEEIIGESENVERVEKKVEKKRSWGISTILKS